MIFLNVFEVVKSSQLSVRSLAQAMRVPFILSAVLLASACQTAFDVKPTTEIAALNTSAGGDPIITLEGTEAFDRTINPVTFSCSIIDFNLRFAETAEQIIDAQLRKQMGPANLTSLKSVTVTVDEAMIRTMNISDAPFAHRFDVEARIGLTAKSTSSSGTMGTYSATTQSIHTGGTVENSITCSLGKEQLEKSLPILLERAVDALVKKMI